MPVWFDPVLEVALIEREALARARAKMAAQQLGECFRDLPATPERRT